MTIIENKLTEPASEKFPLLLDNLNNLNHLQMITDAVADLGGKIILLKGASLLVQFEEYRSKRSICDIDILLHPDYVDIFIERMKILNYDELKNMPAKRSDLEKFSLYSKVNEIELDITIFLYEKLYLYDRERISEKAIYKRLRNYSYNNSNIYLLGLEDEFIYLIKHLAFHRDLQIQKKWFADIQIFWMNYSARLDRNLLLNIAAEFKLRKTIAIVLYYVDYIYKSNISEVLKIYNKEKIGKIQKIWINYYLFPQRIDRFQYQNKFLMKYANTVIKYILIDSKHDRLFYIISKLFLPSYSVFKGKNANSIEIIFVLTLYYLGLPLIIIVFLFYFLYETFRIKNTLKQNRFDIIDGKYQV